MPESWSSWQLASTEQQAAYNRTQELLAHVTLIVQSSHERCQRTTRSAAQR